jgi:hypothetical protein
MHIHHKMFTILDMSHLDGEIVHACGGCCITSSLAAISFGVNACKDM